MWRVRNMWKWISFWDEAASRVRMGRLLMEVKYHFCGGMIQLPQLGVSSEQPRALDSPSHGHQCLWSCGQAWLGAATGICDIHLEVFFYPVKHSDPVFWLLRLSTALLEPAYPSKAVDSRSHIKLWGAGVCVQCCSHGSSWAISRA